MKATLPHITINGKVFHRVEPLCDAVLVVFYRCAETQQEVKVRYSPCVFWAEKWEVCGTSTYYVLSHDLTDNIYMQEKFIPQYFTAAQDEALDRILNYVLFRD